MVAVVQCLLVLALLAVHSQGQSEDITGLVGNSTLTEWAKFRSKMYYGALYVFNLRYNNSTQFLFPGLKFRCNGTVTKWIVGARLYHNGNRTEYPALGIYSPREGNVADRVGASVFVQETFIPSNVYEFTPDPPLPFQDGDTLGIYAPPQREARLGLYVESVTEGPGYQSYNPSSPTPYGVSMFDFAIGANGRYVLRSSLYPMIGVEIESDDPDSTGCTRDFINRDVLELFANSLFYSRLQFFFSGFRFPRDGLVTSWTLAARWNSGTDQNSFPELQIWRRVNGTINYEKIDNTTMTAAARSPNHLYSGNVDPPLQFQSGDLLGMHHPDTSDSRLSVVFTYDARRIFELRWSSVPLSSIELGRGVVVNVKYRPQLALGIVFSSTISPSTIATATTPEPPTTESASPISTEPPTTESASPSSTEPPTIESASPTTPEPPTTESASPSSTDPFDTDHPSSSQTVTIAIGVVAAVLLLAVLALVIFIAVFCCLNRKKVVSQHSNGADQPSGKDEPIYDCPIRIETTVFTKHNEAYATTAVSAARYCNQAYATAHSGNTADAEYEYIY